MIRSLLIMLLVISSFVMAQPIEPIPPIFNDSIRSNISGIVIESYTPRDIAFLKDVDVVICRAGIYDSFRQPVTLENDFRVVPLPWECFDSVKTWIDGRFIFNNIRNDFYRIVFNKVGYETKIVYLHLVKDTSLEVELKSLTTTVNNYNIKNNTYSVRRSYGGSYLLNGRMVTIRRPNKNVHILIKNFVK